MVGNVWMVLTLIYGVLGNETYGLVILNFYLGGCRDGYVVPFPFAKNIAFVNFRRASSHNVDAAGTGTPASVDGPILPSFWVQSQRLERSTLQVRCTK